jgi:hypothetical protein
MTVGNPTTKAGLDTLMGLEVAGLWNALKAVSNRQLWLADAARNSPYLTTTLGYTSGEETLLRAAYTDMSTLSGIAFGTAPPGFAYAYFGNAKNLAGLNWNG